MKSNISGHELQVELDRKVGVFPTRAIVRLRSDKKTQEQEIFNSGGIEPGQKVRIEKEDWEVIKVLKGLDTTKPGGTVRR